MVQQQQIRFKYRGKVLTGRIVGRGAGRKAKGLYQIEYKDPKGKTREVYLSPRNVIAAERAKEIVAARRSEVITELAEREIGRIKKAERLIEEKRIRDLPPGGFTPARPSTPPMTPAPPPMTVASPTPPPSRKLYTPAPPMKDLRILPPPPMTPAEGLYTPLYPGVAFKSTVPMTPAQTEPMTPAPMTPFAGDVQKAISPDEMIQKPLTLPEFTEIQKKSSAFFEREFGRIGGMLGSEGLKEVERRELKKERERMLELQRRGFILGETREGFLFVPQEDIFRLRAAGIREREIRRMSVEPGVGASMAFLRPFSTIGGLIAGGPEEAFGVGTEQFTREVAEFKETKRGVPEFLIGRTEIVPATITSVGFGVGFGAVASTARGAKILAHPLVKFGLPAHIGISEAHTLGPTIMDPTIPARRKIGAVVGESISLLTGFGPAGIGVSSARAKLGKVFTPPVVRETTIIPEGLIAAETRYVEKIKAPGRVMREITMPETRIERVQRILLGREHKITKEIIPTEFAGIGITTDVGRPETILIGKMRVTPPKQAPITKDIASKRGVLLERPLETGKGFEYGFGELVTGKLTKTKVLEPPTKGLGRGQVLETARVEEPSVTVTEQLFTEKMAMRPSKTIRTIGGKMAMRPSKTIRTIGGKFKIIEKKEHLREMIVPKPKDVTPEEIAFTQAFPESRQAQQVMKKITPTLKPTTRPLEAVPEQRAFMGQIGQEMLRAVPPAKITKPPQFRPEISVKLPKARAATAFAAKTKPGIKQVQQLGISTRKINRTGMKPAELSKALEKTKQKEAFIFNVTPRYGVRQKTRGVLREELITKPVTKPAIRPTFPSMIVTPPFKRPKKPLIPSFDESESYKQKKAPVTFKGFRKPKAKFKPSLVGYELGARLRKTPRFVGAGGVVGIRPVVAQPQVDEFSAPALAPVKKSPPMQMPFEDRSNIPKAFRRGVKGFFDDTFSYLGGNKKPKVPRFDLGIKRPKFSKKLKRFKL
jgi:hypothetical protein